MGLQFIIQFLVLTFLVAGVIIFVLHRVLFSAVDGAKQRLERDAQAARAKEAELSQKVKEVNEELQRRKQELDVLEKKMKGELEEQANKEKEALVTKARQEAEEIITKAQNARDSIRREIEKTMEVKIIDYSVKITNEVLSQKAKAVFDQQLIQEFIEKLKTVDMSKIAGDIQSADIITSGSVDQRLVSEVNEILNGKLNRRISLNPKSDTNVVGGAVIQFGSLVLDGSLKCFIKEAAAILKQEEEKK